MRYDSIDHKTCSKLVYHPHNATQPYTYDLSNQKLVAEYFLTFRRIYYYRSPLKLICAKGISLGICKCKLCHYLKPRVMNCRTRHQLMRLLNC